MEEARSDEGESFADGSCNLILYIGYILYIVKSLCDINGYVFTIKCGDGGHRARPCHGRARPRRSSLLDARLSVIRFVVRPNVRIR